jgi:hypothetical protein
MRAATTNKNELVEYTKNHAVLLGETPAIVLKVWAGQEPAQHYPKDDARHRAAERWQRTCM